MCVCGVWFAHAACVYKSSSECAGASRILRVYMGAWMCVRLCACVSEQSAILGARVGTCVSVSNILKLSQGGEGSNQRT